MSMLTELNASPKRVEIGSRSVVMLSIAWEETPEINSISYYELGDSKVSIEVTT